MRRLEPLLILALFAALAMLLCVMIAYGLLDALVSAVVRLR